MKIFIRNCTIALVSAMFLMSITCNEGIMYEQQIIILNNQTDEDIMFFSMTYPQDPSNVNDLKSIYDCGRILSANSATTLDSKFWLGENGAPMHNYIQIFIIRRTTLDKHPFDYLLENNIYDDLLMFSFDELKLMDFQIIYKD